ncbi:hypothetical protein BBK14_28205 [Parafrankia soli]|uniref:Transposase IS200-like domain-containing protein n=1 Tax=Parafrankia soli TaxID=2599596 RepID=A0A1S1PBN3_9ACTN|nr:transposase [Parafrankia soli]OHV20343.1 hypothetical protein BBK14_28205 [Parafrankia soli]
MVRVVVGAGGVYGLGYRMVWRPKYRRLMLASPVCDRCDGLIRQKCTEREWTVAALEVPPDPVDLFVKVHLRHFPPSVADQLEGQPWSVERAG